MNIDDDVARHLEHGSHRGQILREPEHRALKGHCKNITVRAEDPGKRVHLRWRREPLDSNASIRRLRPCLVSGSGHKTIDLRRGGTFER